MRDTQKNQILNLHKEGYGIEDIINKGFSKKYVTQVLRSSVHSNLDSLPTINKTTIEDLKQIIASLENLQKMHDKINISINISIKVDSCNAILDDSNDPLLNPIATIRTLGECGLIEKLKLLCRDDLLKIIKTFTPDLSGKINKKKDPKVLISYIVERSSNLSKLGQVFRDVGKTE